ncbi:phenylalanine--tRNA ligase subunit beta [Thiohalorhabdus methylotrophus]|uniref:Phenylalanine--tRNA ligase beta subunit n=1 Tax=Thiohalorhabdus methylotrophus TaxID=3242694 RepID=A0ABV4TWC5_9GAMM
MRFSERWLAEWVEHDWDQASLVHRLTMAGLEVEGTEYLGQGLDMVLVGVIETCEQHPNADRLSLCTVDAGEGHARSIVCGADNMGPGDKVPVAVPGALLPNGLKIKKSKLRGEVSEGMLCSETELGLAEESAGLMILPADAPVGAPVLEYLELDDTVVELDLTPNRGDCLSIAGVAREVAALADCPLVGPPLGPVTPVLETRRGVHLEAGPDCPRYLGRVVEEVDPSRRTPFWMQERLRRCGVRPVSLLVDITNYVMLELGQPLHAFDNDRLTGDVRVRHARSGEPVTLLDGSAAELEAGALVIADDAGVQAVAGVMGAEATAVGEATANVFLEAAHFRPGAVAGRARKLGLHTDASHRFERGVDPHLPVIAMERATSLLVELAGGKAGPVVEGVNEADLPQRPVIPFRPARADARLGTNLGAEAMGDAFRRLSFEAEEEGEEWEVVPPSFRFDLTLEADLIEEVARLHGYDQLPTARMVGPMEPHAGYETDVQDRPLRQALVDRGYREVITYSFVDPEIVARLDPEADPLALANPLSREQSVMRPDLFAGLLETAAANQARQNHRLRLFELGRVFPQREGALQQRDAIGGLLAGPVDPPHWEGRKRSADFFDAKGDVEALLRRAGVSSRRTELVADTHPALHPGQAARILVDGEETGWLGTLHPSLAEAVEVSMGTVLYQLDLEVLRGHSGGVPRYQPVSRLPVTHRDLAVVVPEAVTAAALEGLLAEGLEEGPLSLVDWQIFDVYTGKGIEEGFKSMGLSLTLQARDETPTDEQIDAAVSQLVERFGNRLGATLRA